MADLRGTLAGLRSLARGRQPFLDLALGMDVHVRRHLVPLAAARRRIVSYLEAGDLTAIDAAVSGGFPILRRADSLVGGFEELWRKAMRSLREIAVDPRPAAQPRATAGR